MYVRDVFLSTSHIAGGTVAVMAACGQGTLNIISTNSILNSVIVDFVIGVKLRPNKHFGME